MSFPELSAETRIQRYLEAAIGSGRVPHGLLFLGPEGGLQMEASRCLAMALFCRERKGVAGCGECVSCRQVSASSHPDLRVFEAEEASRTIKIEQIRSLISEAQLKPFQAPCKVFVVRGADQMNDVAQNALLKTLEEPPANTYLILICHAAEKLLQTLRSRTHALHFHALKPGETDREMAGRLGAMLASRAVRGMEVATPDPGAAKREEVLRAFDAAIEELRQALLIRAGCEEVLSSTTDILEQRRYAERSSIERLVEIIEQLSETKEKIEQSANIRLALADLWERV